jgi:predicted enzyme related to lactoylglutathione lyase
MAATKVKMSDLTKPSARKFDHVDLRVSDMIAAKAFYDVLMPALGFARSQASACGFVYEVESNQPKPEFFGLIEDRGHQPNASRLAFWSDTKERVDDLAKIALKAGAKNLEGPIFCPEYSPTYYAMFFEDPCGNRLEICCRTAKGNLR